MVAKKTEKSNLENKRFLFFEIGMAIALALGLLAFEWSSADDTTNDWANNWTNLAEYELELDIIRTERKEPVIEKPKVPVFEIVEDKIEIEDPTINFDVGADFNDAVYSIPEPTIEDEPEDLGYVIRAEEMPQYNQGGLEKFHSYIQSIVKYPELAIDLGLQGKVFVQFIVDKQGNVSNINIVRGVDPLLDNEVIAAIKKSEKWKPGRQNGIPVNVAMSMPVAFRLQ